MVGNDSMVGVALVFGSAGDIMLGVRDDPMVQEDNLHLFQLGAGLFLVEHILIIYQFTTFWKSFRVSSLIPYVLVLIVHYAVVLPSISQALTTMVIVYSMTMTTYQCIVYFLSINALDPYLALNHEQMNVFATVVFLLSALLVISREIKVNQDVIELMAMIKGIDDMMLRIGIMVTYYALKWVPLYGKTHYQ